MDITGHADPLITHGGNLAAARQRFGTPPEGWLDLSTGINPHAYPIPETRPGLWRDLPDPNLQQPLLDAARICFGAPADRSLVVAPGTQALIQWLPRLRAASRVAIVEPTYAEHAAAWRLAGHTVSGVASLEDAVTADADVVVLVNPNNPDGCVYAPDVLQEVRAGLASRGGWLVVDEAFADIDPKISLAATEKAEGLLILRSFGKFFGLAGARVGFALGDGAIVLALGDALGPWPVPGPALHIAAQAYADSVWIGDMRKRLVREAAALDRLLEQYGIPVIGGTPLFRLARTGDAHRLFVFLGECGILTRPFAEQKDWLRFGLPGDGFARLAAALGEYANSGRDI